MRHRGPGVRVTGLLARVDAGGLPLTAVMHAAGVLDDGVLDRLDTGRLAGVLAAKAAGAAFLDELTRDLGLDQFVLFSSAAATLEPVRRQGNYAAANAYLDALAQHRAGRGQAGLSLAWGPWAGGGVAQSSEAVRQRMRRGALPEMDPALAIEALGHALTGPDRLPRADGRGLVRVRRRTPPRSCGTCPTLPNSQGTWPAAMARASASRWPRGNSPGI